MKISLANVGSILLASLLVAGCNYQVKKSNGSDGGGGLGSKPEAALAFADVKPVLDRACVTCHSEFKSYEELMASGDVKAGDAAGSDLFMQLQQNGGKMPKKSGPIPDSDAALIRDWINGGALLNLPSDQEPKPEPTPEPTPTPTPAPEAGIYFADVQPILDRACVKCHEEFAKFDTLMGEKVVTPGDASKSELFSRLKNNGGDMPKKSNAIPDADAALIREWINGGALLAVPSDQLPQPAPAPEPPPKVEPAPPTNEPAPPKNEPKLATYSELQGQVFSKKCTMCHGDKSLAGGFSLEHYDSIVTNARLIVKGNSAESGLWQSVGGPDAFMPPKRAVASGKIQAITPAEIEALKTWIDAGSPQN